MRIAIIVALAIVLTPVLLIRFRRRWVAAFNLRVTNRITGRFADRLPGFGIITHIGRKSGRTFHTPVNVFPRQNVFLVALTYGPEAEWVKNVLAAGGCALVTRGRQYQLTDPVIEHDPARKQFPLGVRTILGIIGANDFLRLTISTAQNPHSGKTA
jgi:deazaflavin-dependent oxidoreductase (nitroreductase family)